MYSPLFAYIDELRSGDALHISRIYLSIRRLSGICTCLLHQEQKVPSVKLWELPWSSDFGSYLLQLSKYSEKIIIRILGERQSHLSVMFILPMSCILCVRNNDPTRVTDNPVFACNRYMSGTADPNY